jgi:hypothetical protein
LIILDFAKAFDKVPHKLLARYFSPFLKIGITFA